MEPCPIDDDELGALFDGLFGERGHVVLAVSGGADSTALMYLAAAWRARSPRGAPLLSVVTVDHGLRAGSHAEAEAVARMAQALALEHTILVWTGDKPTTGIQAAARAARRELITHHMAQRGCSSLALAHTADDQAETLLMRLARGSGVDGLGAMRPVVEIDGCWLLRPLLAVAKSRLVATLRTRGIDWIDDPSNQQPRFERVRLRQAAPALAAAGLDDAHLGLASRRLARASAGLEGATALLAADAEADGRFRVNTLGYIEIHWPWLLELPPEIRLRVLSRCIRAVGGRHEPPISLGRLEAMTEACGWRRPAGRTLAGCMLADGEDGRLLVLREAGRRGLPVVSLGPGDAPIWDARFRLQLADRAETAYTAAALTAPALAEIEAEGVALPAAPARALMAVPGLWHGPRLAAAPSLAFYRDGLTADEIRVVSLVRPFSSARASAGRNADQE